MHLNPITPQILNIQVATCIAISFAGRSCELHDVCFENVRRLVDAEGKVEYEIRYTRRKNTSARSTDETFSLIVGDLEIAIIDNYISLFDLDARCGPFFRYLIWADNTKSRMKGTNKRIGINVLKAYPSKIAEMLKLEHANSYSSHSWRRTTASSLAAKNFNLVNIKNITGHKSDKVVQGYIDCSRGQKLKAAKALAVNSPSQTEFVEEIEDYDDVYDFVEPPKFSGIKRKSDSSVHCSSPKQIRNYVFNIK